MKVHVIVTSPFGRRGEVVEVDAESPRAQKYLEKGLLKEIPEDDAPDSLTGTAAPQEIEEDDAWDPEVHPEVDTVSQPASGIEEIPAFDPGVHSVADVREYLRTASEQEVGRVLDMERADKARTSLVG